MAVFVWKDVQPIERVYIVSRRGVRLVTRDRFASPEAYTYKYNGKWISAHSFLEMSIKTNREV